MLHQTNTNKTKKPKPMKTLKMILKNELTGLAVLLMIFAMCFTIPFVINFKLTFDHIAMGTIFIAPFLFASIAFFTIIIKEAKK